MAPLIGNRPAAAGPAAAPAGLRPGRRSWALAAAGALVVAGCALASAAGWAQAGNRQPVLAIIRGVAAGQLLSAADLAVVRASVSGPVRLVPAGQEASVLGRPAAMPLPAGALLAAGDIGAAGPPAGDQELGVAVRSGQYPPDLSAGQSVDVLATPPAPAAGSSQAQPQAPALPAGQAVVLAVDQAADAGATVVELLVSQDMVAQVAAAAAAGQVSLATIPAGR